MNRLRHFNTYCPYELTLLAQFPGSLSDETRLHRKFAKMRSRGEWFRKCPEIEAIITNGLPSHDGPYYTVKIKRIRSLSNKERIFGLSDALMALNGPRALARALGKISAQAVSQWQTVPPRRVLEVERVTGVSRHRLRPDLYPIEN